MADEKKKTTRKKKEETAAEELEAPVVSEEVQAEAGEVEAEPVAEQAVAEEPANVEEPAPAEEPVAEPKETVAEAEPAPGVEAEAAEAEAPAPPQPEPKRKRKHVPRAQRRQRPKNRVPSAERKPITRLPKPEGDRGRTQERRGVVVSSAMDKTIVVRVDAVRAHPKYKKVIRRSKKLHAHDEQNTANVGDVVRIVETRPLSATKRWRLAEVLEVAK
jgi:small subunit ribosomal protein S17